MSQHILKGYRLSLLLMGRRDALSGNCARWPGWSGGRGYFCDARAISAPRNGVPIGDVLSTPVSVPIVISIPSSLALFFLSFSFIPFSIASIIPIAIAIVFGVCLRLAGAWISRDWAGSKHRHGFRHGRRHEGWAGNNAWNIGNLRTGG